MKKMILLGLVASLGLVACDKAEAPATADAPKEEPAKIQADPAAPAEAEKAEKPEAAPEKAEAAAVATIGQPAPEFELKDETGKAHKLSDYKGKTVVLEWTRPDCPFVVRHYEAKTMETTFEKLGKEDVVWLAIDSSHFVKAEESAAWKKKEGFSYPVLQDSDGKTGKLYAAKTTPHMFVIDAEGVLQYDGAIDNNPKGDEKNIVNHLELAVNAVKAGKKVENAKNKPYGCSVKYAEK